MKRKAGRVTLTRPGAYQAPDFMSSYPPEWTAIATLANGHGGSRFRNKIELKQANVLQQHCRTKDFMLSYLPGLLTRVLHTVESAANILPDKKKVAFQQLC